MKAMTYEVELLPTDCADCRPADVVREPLPRKLRKICASRNACKLQLQMNDSFHLQDLPLVQSDPDAEWAVGPRLRPSSSLSNGQRNEVDMTFWNSTYMLRVGASLHTPRLRLLGKLSALAARGSGG